MITTVVITWAMMCAAVAVGPLAKVRYFPAVSAVSSSGNFGENVRNGNFLKFIEYRAGETVE
jgi:hypothetical protein